MNRKLLFIFNPHSGKGLIRNYLVDIVDTMVKAEFDVTIYTTQARADATRKVLEEGAGYDQIVCSGGDGTLDEVVTGMIQANLDIPLGYIPAGSTNDFAASLHLSSDPRLAALDIAGGQPHPLDIGRHNDRYFAYVASFGAFTRSSYSASQAAKNALGHFAYILEGLGDLDSLRPYNCRIEADGEVFEGDFIFGAVCNCTSMGGLVKLDPNRVKMDDGQFELLLLRMPKTALDLQNLITAMTRMQYDYPGVIFRHVRHVTLTTQSHIPWSLDGEYAPSAERVDIDSLPGAISLLR